MPDLENKIDNLIEQLSRTNEKVDKLYETLFLHNGVIGDVEKLKEKEAQREQDKEKKKYFNYSYGLSIPLIFIGFIVQIFIAIIKGG